MDDRVDHRSPDSSTLEEQRPVIRARTRFQVLIPRLSHGRHGASLASPLAKHFPLGRSREKLVRKNSKEVGDK
jgi:hypothetical protein